MDIAGKHGMKAFRTRFLFYAPLITAQLVSSFGQRCVLEMREVNK